MRIAIVDYGMGNLSSVAKAFETLHVDLVISHDPRDLETADRLVLPGVGAFGEGMRSLHRLGLVGPLSEQVHTRRKPMLGICLGMQLLARDSTEHGRHAGLGWVAGSVEAFQGAHTSLKSIHIGWSDVGASPSSPLFRDLGPRPTFYFVHRYHMVCDDPRIVTGRARYGVPFVAAIQQANVCGVQFHPEKSQETGLGLLRRFVQWTPGADDGPLEAAGAPDPDQPRTRVVPTLLLHGSRLTKTVRFELQTSGLRRDVGHQVKAPMVYDAQLADELVYLDIRATQEQRDIGALEQVIARVGGACFMPLTAGGGVRTTDDIRRLLRAGADKVVINSAAVARPALIAEAADRFGSQCIVVAIDVVRRPTGEDVVATHSGTRAADIDPVTWAREAERLGAGEIMLTSVERDGTMEGYDLPLTRRVTEAVDIPVIVSGGAGSLRDLAAGAREAGASAVAAASLFHFTDQSPIKAKAFLRREGVPVR